MPIGASAWTWPGTIRGAIACALGAIVYRFFRVSVLERLHELPHLVAWARPGAVWGAAMGPLLLCLRTILGLEPDLSRQRVVIEPALPPWLERVDVRDLRAYEARVSFRVRRTAKGVRVVGGRSRVARATVATRA